MDEPCKGSQLSQLLEHDQVEGDLGAEPGHTDGTTSPRWPMSAMGKSAALVAITTLIQVLSVARIMGRWVDGFKLK